MSLIEIMTMMDASGYPYNIIVDDVLAEGDTAFIFNDFSDEPVGKISLTPNDDITVQNLATGKELTFVDLTDVIMWIVQNL